MAPKQAKTANAKTLPETGPARDFGSIIPAQADIAEPAVNKTAVTIPAKAEAAKRFNNGREPADNVIAAPDNNGMKIVMYQMFLRDGSRPVLLK